MNRLTESFLGFGLSAGLVLGVTACGDSEQMSEEARSIEINRLQGELSLAQAALTTGQIEYNLYLDSLPDDCEVAVRAYVPPQGELRRTDIDIATEQTAKWCGPEHLGAVAVLRGMFDGLNSLQSKVDGLDWSIAAHVAASGVTLPENR